MLKYFEFSKFLILLEKTKTHRLLSNKPSNWKKSGEKNKFEKKEDFDWVIPKRGLG